MSRLSFYLLVLIAIAAFISLPTWMLAPIALFLALTVDDR